MDDRHNRKLRKKPASDLEREELASHQENRRVRATMAHSDRHFIAAALKAFGGDEKRQSQQNRLTPAKRKKTMSGVSHLLKVTSLEPGSAMPVKNARIGAVWAILIFSCLACVTSSSAKDEPWKLSFRTYSFGYSKSEPQAIAISPNGKILAVGCRDKTIRLWDLEQGRELRRLVGHESAPLSLAFSPDNKRVISTSQFAYPHAPIRIWSVATGEQLYQHKVKTESAGGVAYHPSGRFFAVAISTTEPDGRYFGSSTDLFDATTFKRIRKISTSRSARKRLGFSRDGSKLLLGEGNGYPARLHDMKTGRQQDIPKGVVNCAISPDGKYIVGRGERTPHVIILDANTLKEVRRLPIPGLRNGGGPAGTRFRNVQFHPVDRSIVATTGKYWIQWNLATGKVIKGGKLSYASDGIFKIGPDGDRLLEVGGYNQIVLWNLKTGEKLAKLYCLDEIDEWAVETAGGYFQHSDGVSPTKLDSTIPRDQKEQYLAKHRSSTMVARLLSGMSVKDAEALPENGVPPTVDLRVVSTEQEFATIEVIARSRTPAGKIRNVSVRVDGREFDTTQTKAIVVEAVDSAASSAAEKKFETKVAFPPGRNTARIQAVAVDSFGQQSQQASVVITRPKKVKPVPGRLFVLAVGVSEYDNEKYNLEYCDDDAKAIAEQFLNQKGRAFGDVQVQVFTNKNATVTNIKGGLDWLQKSCTSSDVAIVLFSGHGIKKERGLYYVTHEANMNGVQFTCLNWETIAESLKQTQARQILFLSDACYAGAFGETNLAPQQELADSLRNTAGVMVFSSSRGDEVSRENAEWGHGAFCKAMLDGLPGKADLNGDGQITVEEFSHSVTKQVIEMTNGKQHPDLSRLGQFDPDLVIAKTSN